MQFLHLLIVVARKRGTAQCGQQENESVKNENVQNEN